MVTKSLLYSISIFVLDPPLPLTFCLVSCLLSHLPLGRLVPLFILSLSAMCLHMWSIS